MIYRDKIKIQYEDIPIIIPVFKCHGNCDTCSNPLCLII